MTFPTPKSCRSRLFTPVVAALLAAACGAMAGCNRTDQEQVAIDTANVQMDAQIVAGANPVYSAKQRARVFNDVVASLKPIADGGDPSHASSATLLIARAKSGLGEIAASDAADVERQFLASSTVTRALLNQWTSQHATAESLSRYDPSKDLADLDREIAGKSAEMTTLTAGKAKQDAAVAAIRARADGFKAEARAQRTREASIRMSAEGKSQTAREDIIRQAVEASRAADALDRQAAELNAEAEKEAPESDEIANQIERLEAQVDSLRKAKENIEGRASAARSQSARAKADASAIGPTIAASLNALAGLRENASKPAKDAAARYSEASALAAKSLAGASREGKTAGQSLLGTSQQSLADVLAAKARSLAIYVRVLDAAAEARPAIPDAADVARRAADARAELESARADAEAAYEKARSAYLAAGGSTELQARLKGVAESLEHLKEERARPPEPPKAPEPAPAETSAAKPIDGGAAKPESEATALTAEQEHGVEAGARDVLKRASDAMMAGDLAALKDLMDLGSDAEKTAFDATMPLAVAAKAFEEACVARYGKGLKGLLADSRSPAVKSNPLFQMAGPQLDAAGKAARLLAPDNVAKATVKVLSATRADAMLPGDEDPTHIAKVGDAWKIDPGDEARNSAGMVGPMMPMIKGMTTALKSVTTDIGANKFSDADEMLIALAGRLMGAMNPGGGGGRSPPPGGGGGGGGKMAGRNRRRRRCLMLRLTMYFSKEPTLNRIARSVFFVLVAALATAISTVARAQSIPDSVITAPAIPDRSPLEALVNQHKADLASPALAARARKALSEPLFRSARPSASFRIAYSGALMPVAGPLVKNASDEVAVNAVRLAGLVGTKDGIEAAEEAMGDAREAVRVAGAGAVGVAISTCRTEGHALLPSAANEAVKKIEDAMKTETSPRVLDALAIALENAMRVPSERVERLRSNATDALLGAAERMAASRGYRGAEFDGFFTRTASTLADMLRTTSEPPTDTQKQRAAQVAGDILVRAARRLNEGTLDDAARQELGLMADQAEFVVKLTLKRDNRLGDLVRAGKDAEFKDKSQVVFRELGQPPYSQPESRYKP